MLSRRTATTACNNEMTQFYLITTHEPYFLSALPSRKASPPFDWYQVILFGYSEAHKLRQFLISSNFSFCANRHTHTHTQSA